MGSAEPRARAEALLSRYLDPTGRWTAKEDRTLRELVREHASAREVHDRAVLTHRMMVGADPDLPSGFEQQRMMNTLMEALPLPKMAAEPAAEARRPWWAVWLRPLSVGAAALALGLVLLVSSSRVEQIVSPDVSIDPADILLPRGPGGFELTVGIGISGVAGDAREYEALQPGTSLYIEDRMKITTTRQVDDYPYVLVFGLQPSRPTIWYYPDPAEGEHGSQPVPQDKFVPLGPTGAGIEFQLGGRHVTGPLTVIAVFSRQPVQVSTIAAVLPGWDGGLSIEERVRLGTGLAEDGIIRILDVSIREGKKDRSDGSGDVDE